MQNPACPICSSQATKFYFTHQGFEKPFSLYVCEHCKSYFQYPLPAKIEDYYQKEYFSGLANFSYQDERNLFGGAKHVWDSRLKNICKYSKKEYKKEEVTFLDVGCSFGGLVQRASRYFAAYGLDLSAYAVKEGNAWAKLQCQNKNFKGLYQGTLLQLPKAIASQHFDVITLIEVIEHLENPRAAMQSAYNLLKEDGMLVVQTANFEGWQAIKKGKDYHYFLPGHLNYFTDSGMRLMLDNIGFRRYRAFYPVDFSLWAKLKKSRHGFKNFQDYQRWLKIFYYHISGKLFFKGRPLQSSYVLYAFKKTLNGLQLF